MKKKHNNERGRKNRRRKQRARHSAMILNAWGLELDAFLEEHEHPGTIDPHRMVPR